MHFRKRAFVSALLLFLSSGTLATALSAQESGPATASQTEAAPIIEPPVWPFDDSDIEPDPDYVYGQLENGMRFILRQNATPEGTALVRMRIDSGSLEETDSERGLAHYLEHMAFNGSRGIPEGEMVKLLEREGLAFGADTNASTGFDAITYMLNLPRNDEELLDTALMLMRETASELTIAPDAVERERGVILAERRDRAGFQQRAYEDNVQFIAPGARYGERLPIGTVDVLENASAADLRALYQRSYTPANTVLVVVGDFPVAMMEAKVRERFADWAPAPAPGDPVSGPIDVTRKGLTDIHLDPALSESVTISRLGEWRDEPDTIANRDLSLIRRIGYAIINRRLARLARGEDAPFRGASFGSGDLFEDARITSLSVSSADGEWRKGVLAAVRELNEALTFGFTQAELDEQLANILTVLENAVKAADTRANAVFVNNALQLVANERIPTTPEYQLAAVERLAPAITPQAAHRAVLDDAAQLSEPLIRFQGRAAPEGGEDALRAAFAEGMALPIAAPADNGPLTFGYSTFGEPGEIVSDTIEERLGLRLIRFANGVRLNLKQTDIRKDRIAFALAVDGGSLMNTPEAPLRTYLAGSLPAGGLGKHSQDELTSVLAGRSVSLNLSTGTDAFTASGGTTPRDLELQMQLLAAALTDPGYRPEGVERFRKGIDNFFETLVSTPSRALASAIGGILSDRDPRFTLQPKEAFFALDYNQLRAEIGDRLAEGAIEIAIVGDFEESAAIAAVAATLGGLPQRESEFQPREELRTRSFTAQRGQRSLTHKGEDDQALLQWIWPTTDDSDQNETLRLELLARVMRLELIERLREKLGQAYSPSASASNSSHYRNYGTFTLASSVDVAQVEVTRSAIATMLAELRTEPVSADTIQRARKPLLEAYDNALKDLGGWLNLARRAQSDPERLDRWFAAPDVVKAVTPEDLLETAQIWLSPEAAVELIVVPEATEHSGEIGSASKG